MSPFLLLQIQWAWSKTIENTLYFFYLQFFKVDIVIENVFRQVLQLVIVQVPISKRRQLVYVTA